jgi:hypothetical protein
MFELGEQIDGYAVRVVNERAFRAAAGLLFVPAFISFMNTMLQGNFQPTRLLINPKGLPSMIVGQGFVRNLPAPDVF